MNYEKILNFHAGWKIERSDEIYWILLLRPWRKTFVWRIFLFGSLNSFSYLWVQRNPCKKIINKVLKWNAWDLNDYISHERRSFHHVISSHSSFSFLHCNKSLEPDFLVGKVSRQQVSCNLSRAILHQAVQFMNGLNSWLQ